MKFYRYETGDVVSFGIVFCDTALLTAHLKLTEFFLVKETPKGYWIGLEKPNGWSNQTCQIWISKTSKKRYAYPTKEEALKSRIAINKRRIKFLKRDLEIAKQVLNQCENELEKLKETV